MTTLDNSLTFAHTQTQGGADTERVGSALPSAVTRAHSEYLSLCEQLDRMECRFPGMRFELEYLGFPYGTTLRTYLQAKDRETGGEMEIVSVAFVSGVFPLHVVARRQAFLILEHEVDECIYVDGKRVFDPHGEQQ